MSRWVLVVLASGVVIACEETRTTDDAGTDSAQPDGVTINSAVCSDGSLGSGTTASPTPAGENSFTTELQPCSLSAEEIAFCSGVDHESSVVQADGTRTITGNAIPNHDVGVFPNSGNPSTISAQDNLYTVSANPVKTTTATRVNVVGVAINGIKMEPETAETFNGEGQWRYAALTFGGRLADDVSSMPPSTTLGVDCNFAHVQPTGEYHYHGNPTALMPTEPAVVLIGWAADGFPILGRYGQSDPGDASSPLVELTGSYRLRTGARQALGGETVPMGDYDGTFEQDWEYDPSVGDLDECNGRDESVTVDGEEFAYAYYLTHTYPFMPRCVFGTPDPSFVRGPGPPGGM